MRQDIHALVPKAVLKSPALQTLREIRGALELAKRLERARLQRRFSTRSASDMNPAQLHFHRLCVFCGSSKGARENYLHAAQQLGRELAARNIELVYGGGNVGLMGAVANAVLAAGGCVTGVITEHLTTFEIGHLDIQDLRVVKTMHERKALMAELTDGFIAMPGGIGTYEEFFEVLTWAQLGIHSKPCALLNVDGFYDPLLSLLDHAVEERFVRAAHRDLIVVESEPAALLDRMAKYHAPHVHKWIDKSTL